MDAKNFYELILDNIIDGVYILDDAGNYVYANSSYIDWLGIPKCKLLSMNVHDFLKNDQIDLCISDIVYREKRRVVAFQNVAMVNDVNVSAFRQLVVSTPIFGPDGKIQNVVALCKPLHVMDNLMREADSISSNISLFNGSAGQNLSIVAESQAMLRIMQEAREVADIDASVLITGESGTGKEVIAQYIHSQSSRKKGELVVVNCAALPENLLESELFGYEKGAFTGALSTGKAGLFETANGSTLFLDEINSLPIALQGKLLRTLETKTVQRIGSTKSKTVDFRLITATNEDLLTAVHERRFRSDLYYRLNVIPLEIPALRNRTADIIPLAYHFLDDYNHKYNKQKRFTNNTLTAMEAYDWVGNVRELKNFVERSVVMTAGDLIDIDNIRSVAASHEYYIPRTGRSFVEIQEEEKKKFPWEKWLERELPLQEYLDRCEEEYLALALNKYKSSYLTADHLGTSQSSIMRRKKKYGM